jgi:hypothetical protein
MLLLQAAVLTLAAAESTRLAEHWRMQVLCSDDDTTLARAEAAGLAETVLAKLRRLGGMRIMFPERAAMVCDAESSTYDQEDTVSEGGPESRGSSSTTSQQLPSSATHPSPPPQQLRWDVSRPPMFEQLLRHQRCTIATVDAEELSLATFQKQYRGRRPLMIRNLTQGTRRDAPWPAHEQWEKGLLLQRFGERQILVQPPDIRARYGHAPNREAALRSLAEHVRGIEMPAPSPPPPPTDVADDDDEGAESNGAGEDGSRRPFAIDSDFMHRSAPELRKHWSTPSVLGALADDAMEESALYVGGAGSGLWYHRHGESWDGLVHGSTMWVLFPHGWLEGAQQAGGGGDDRLGMREQRGRVMAGGLSRWLQEVAPSLRGETAATTHGVMQRSGQLLMIYVFWAASMAACPTPPPPSPHSLHMMLCYGCGGR